MGTWTPHAPLDSDNAYISSGTLSNATVTYDIENLTLGVLQIDGENGNILELQQMQGTLTSVSNEFVGFNGSAIYTQSGGSNIVGNEGTQGKLYLGYNTGSMGVYNLNGGRLSVSGDGYIGYAGSGIFNQSGDVSVTLGDLYLGYNPGSDGSYNISGGNLQVRGFQIDNNAYTTGWEIIGYSGNAVVNQTGGHNSAEEIRLGYNAGSTFAYNLVDGSFGAIYAELIGCGGTGTFTQSGGSNVADLISLGADSTYYMSGGKIRAIGENINGRFIQSGGSNFIGVGLSVYGNSATYELSGSGSITASFESVKDSGIFDQAGGSNIISYDLTIGSSTNDKGTYNLRGGSLQAGNIVNNDDFNYSGGTLEANITNNGTFNVGGIGVRTIDGDVTNNGIVKVTNTISQYTGTLTNNGAYISDPAVNIFNNLVIGQDGYLKGDALDEFIISGYIEIYSTNPLWDTSSALLGFIGEGIHDLFQTRDYYWGTLSIYECYLSLSGTGDLYVKNLLGLAFDDSELISNIWGNGLNIYYDAFYNPWLDRNTYSLMGGGSLIAYNMQAPVPEPSTLILFSAGLLGLAGLRKKMKNNYN